MLFVHINFSLKGHEVRGYVAMVMDFPSLASLKGLITEFIRRGGGVIRRCLLLQGHALQAKQAVWHLLEPFQARLHAHDVPRGP